jgi:hypothetical protein
MNDGSFRLSSESAGFALADAGTRTLRTARAAFSTLDKPEEFLIVPTNQPPPNHYVGIVT